MGRRVPVKLNGVTYPSIARAAAAGGVSRQALAQQLARQARGPRERPRHRPGGGRCSRCGQRGVNARTCGRSSVHPGRAKHHAFRAADLEARGGAP
jgi:hypothetical protein